MTLDKDFKEGGLAGLSVSKIKIPRARLSDTRCKSQIEVAEGGIKTELEDKLAETPISKRKEATAETRDVLSKRMGELISFVDGLDLDKMFPDLTGDVEGNPSEKRRA